MLVLSGCELLSGRTGGGTETESAGVLHDADGTVAVNARVRVRPSDYLADSLLVGEPTSPVLETWTDSRGRYAFKGLPDGTWLLEAEDSHGRGLVADFAVEGGRPPAALPSDTLRPHGSISGRFAEADSAHRRYVQIFGLERLVKADARTGAFMVGGLPPGTYDLRCLVLEPFRKQAVVRGIRVVSGEVTPIDPVELVTETRLAWRVDSGALVIDGLDARNPVVFDNEIWEGGPDNEFVWALASARRLDLRGNIVTESHRSAQATLDVQLPRARTEARAARQAGMTAIPEPVPGGRRRLALPASGRLEDIVPERSEGSDLIVAEARKASPERPLVVVVGGSLTTVANAWLTDTSIAPRMVVAGIYAFGINAHDTVATQLVARKCRFVHWGRGYGWSLPGDAAHLQALPPGRLGESLRAWLLADAKDGRIALNDIAPIAYLVDRRVWTGADMLRIQQPLSAHPASGLTYDFLDIPAGGNAWDRYRDVYFGALEDAAAYQPAPLPGRLEAEGYAARHLAAPLFAGEVPDGHAGLGHDAVGGFVPGAWIEFRVAPDSARAYAATFRYRSARGGTLRLGEGPQPSAAVIPLPASAAWTVAKASLDLPAGSRTLRVSCEAGALDLDWLEIR